jgi:hypothetical protein
MREYNDVSKRKQGIIIGKIYTFSHGKPSEALHSIFNASDERAPVYWYDSGLF